MSDRTFRLILDGKKGGLVKGSSPSSAAKKACKKLSAETGKTSFKFELQETTKDSKKKVYGPYKANLVKDKIKVKMMGGGPTKNNVNTIRHVKNVVRHTKGVVRNVKEVVIISKLSQYRRDLQGITEKIHNILIKQNKYKSKNINEEINKLTKNVSSNEQNLNRILKNIQENNKSNANSTNSIKLNNLLVARKIILDNISELEQSLRKLEKNILKHILEDPPEKNQHLQRFMKNVGRSNIHNNPLVYKRLGTYANILKEGINQNNPLVYKRLGTYANNLKEGLNQNNEEETHNKPKKTTLLQNQQIENNGMSPQTIWVESNYIVNNRGRFRTKPPNTQHGLPTAQSVLNLRTTAEREYKQYNKQQKQKRNAARTQKYSLEN